MTLNAQASVKKFVQLNVYDKLKIESRKNSIDIKKKKFFFNHHSIDDQSLFKISRLQLPTNSNHSRFILQISNDKNFAFRNLCLSNKHRPLHLTFLSVSYTLRILKDMSTRDNNFLEHRETLSRSLLWSSGFQRINRQAPRVSPAISDRISREHPSPPARDRKRCPDIERGIYIYTLSSFTWYCFVSVPLLSGPDGVDLYQIRYLAL